MNILMIGLWMACALGAQAQQRDVLFRRADGQPRTWGLSVEALYGAYLLEPVPMYTGGGVEFDTQNNPFHTSCLKKSFGRFSNYFGIGMHINLFKGYFQLNTGLFRSTLNFETSPFRYYRSFAEVHGVDFWHGAKEQLRFTEIPIVAKGNLYGKIIAIAAGTGFTYAFVGNESYEGYTYLEYGYPTPVRIPIDGRLSEERVIRSANSVHPIPASLLFWSSRASIHGRIYRWASLGLELSYDRQMNPIESTSKFNAQHKRIIRYGLSASLRLTFL